MHDIRRAAAIVVVTATLFSALTSPAASATVGLSAGTLVTSKMNQTIDSGSAHVGDKFSLTVIAPYPNGNAIYANAQLYGHLTAVVAAGQGRNPVMEFNIDRIALTNGRQASVSMLVQSQETQRHNNTSNVALTALGGMIIGNMIGKSVFKSNLGGAVGLIAGAIYANNKKTNVSMRQGSILVTEVRRSVSL